MVTIVNAGQEHLYNPNIPLEKQIIPGARIIIDIQPNSSRVDEFLSEMERLCRHGISTDVIVEVIHNNNLKGARAKRQAKRLTKDLNVNEAIKLLVKIHNTTDIVLEELANYCQKR